ncbi:MAG: hypothetical protein AB7Y46_06000 [Armatimonadota bacterium]
MTYLAHLALLILATAIERTWPGWLLVREQGPHLVLATVVSIALSAGPVAGCFAGVIGGLLLASMQGAWLGGTFIAYMALGIVVGLLRGQLLAERVLVASLVALLALPVVELIRLVFSAPPSPGPWLLHTLIAAPYTALVAAPVFAAVHGVTSLLRPEP